MRERGGGERAPEAARLQFGAWLRGIRTEHGWRLRDVAARIGMNSGHLSRIERGESEPQHWTLRRIAEGYGLPLSVLQEHLYGVSDQEPADVPVQPAARRVPGPVTAEESTAELGRRIVTVLRIIPPEGRERLLRAAVAEMQEALRLDFRSADERAALAVR